MKEAVAGVLWEVLSGRFRLCVPGVACFLVGPGSGIQVEAAPAADPSEVLRFLNMTPFAALNLQQGRPVFHASVAVPRNPAGPSAPSPAVIIAGDSGCGKSTLLAELLKRGWSAVTDDLAAVGLDSQGRAVVFPCPAPLRLWQDARERLGWDLTEIVPEFREPVPVGTVLHLTVSNRAVEFGALSGTERFRTLTTIAYNSRISDALLDRGAFLRLAGVLAGQASMYRLRRPRGVWTTPELADRVEAVARELFPRS